MTQARHTDPHHAMMKPVTQTHGSGHANEYLFCLIIRAMPGDWVIPVEFERHYTAELYSVLVVGRREQLHAGY